MLIHCKTCDKNVKISGKFGKCPSCNSVLKIKPKKQEAEEDKNTDFVETLIPESAPKSTIKSTNYEIGETDG